MKVLFRTALRDRLMYVGLAVIMASLLQVIGWLAISGDGTMSLEEKHAAGQLAYLAIIAGFAALLGAQLITSLSMPPLFLLARPAARGRIVLGAVLADLATLVLCFCSFVLILGASSLDSSTSLIAPSALTQATLPVPILCLAISIIAYLGAALAGASGLSQGASAGVGFVCVGAMIASAAVADSLAHGAIGHPLRSFAEVGFYQSLAHGLLIAGALIVAGAALALRGATRSMPVPTSVVRASWPLALFPLVPLAVLAATHWHL